MDKRVLTVFWATSLSAATLHTWQLYAPPPLPDASTTFVLAIAEPEDAGKTLSATLAGFVIAPAVLTPSVQSANYRDIPVSVAEFWLPQALVTAFQVSITSATPFTPRELQVSLLTPAGASAGAIRQSGLYTEPLADLTTAVVHNPEPATLLLVGLGLIAVAFWGRRVL